MEFTFAAYAGLLERLTDGGYMVTGYGAHQSGRRKAILRHDVDFDLTAAADFAQRERALGARATYFVLVGSVFYNPFSPASRRAMARILDAGHEIGLHFDETRCAAGAPLWEAVAEEKRLLETAAGTPVRCVSMHRPSAETLRADLRFDGLVNSYSQEYFKDWKHLSDSRMCWREDVIAAVTSGQYPRLHILTHPFWYADQPETTKVKLNRFLARAADERHDLLAENLTDLSDILDREDI